MHDRPRGNAHARARDLSGCVCMCSRPERQCTDLGVEHAQESAKCGVLLDSVDHLMSKGSGRRGGRGRGEPKD